MMFGTVDIGTVGMVYLRKVAAVVCGQAVSSGPCLLNQRMLSLEWTNCN